MFDPSGERVSAASSWTESRGDDNGARPDPGQWESAVSGIRLHTAAKDAPGWGTQSSAVRVRPPRGAAAVVGTPPTNLTSEREPNSGAGLHLRHDGSTRRLRADHVAG